MKNLLPLVALLFVFASCESAKKTSATRTLSKADRIVNQAEAFTGTPYAWGGTTRKGMDCSGLIYVAFEKENIALPRVSRDMATRGKSVKKSAIAKGDLVFFKTDKNSRKINHVGLVTEVTGGVIYFIHATSSRGVLTSRLDEKYWQNAYSQTRRLL